MSSELERPTKRLADAPSPCGKSRVVHGQRLPQEVVEQIRSLHGSGLNGKQIAALLGCSDFPVYKVIKRVSPYANDKVKERAFRSRVFPQFSDADADLREVVWIINKGGYARRTFKGAPEIISHRVVLSRIIGRELTKADICDHINGDRLDNRRENIRLTNFEGNNQNRRHRPNRSGYPNVQLCPDTRKWIGKFEFRRKAVICGWFADPKDAYAAVVAKRNELGLLTRTFVHGGTP